MLNVFIEMTKEKGLVCRDLYEKGSRYHAYQLPWSVYEKEFVLTKGVSLRHSRLEMTWSDFVDDMDQTVLDLLG